MSQSVIMWVAFGLEPKRLFEVAGYRTPMSSVVDEAQPECQVTGMDPDGSSWHITASVPTNRQQFAEDAATNDDLDEEFRLAVPRLSPILVCFNDFKRTRDLLVRFLDNCGRANDVWLDTDYGWVIRGDQLLQRVAEEASWDWRSDPFDA